MDQQTVEPPEPIYIYIYFFFFFLLYVKSNEISIKFALGYKEEKYV